MQEFNLREMITKALGEMKQQGATAKQLKIYRCTGFDNALRYFDRNRVIEVKIITTTIYFIFSFNNYCY